MRYTELNILGVLVSPLSVMGLAAWLALMVLRRVADRFGLWRHVWHPALASLSVYVILLSAIIVAVGM